MAALPAYIKTLIENPANSPLTAERERELGEIITTAREARKHDAFTTVLERQEAKAQEELVRRNIRLVVTIANSFRHRVEIEELIGAGNLALVRAVKAWNPEIGPLAPWAIRWVRSSFTRAVDAARPIRLPEEVAYKAAILANHATALQEALGRPATVSELAEVIELPEDEVRRLQGLPEASLLLDVPSKNGQGSTFIEMRAGNMTDPVEHVEQLDLTERLLLALDELTAREAAVIRARFGLGEDSESVTLVQLGDTMDMSRENVRKLEASALAKLRHPALKVELSELSP
jgi:RNA polymerase sigma factor (sigma-70 family)